MIERLKKAISKLKYKRLNFHINLDSPNNLEANCPYLKIAGFIVNESPFELNEFTYQVGSVKGEFREISRPDLTCIYRNKHIRGFQVILGLDASFYPTTTLEISRNGDSVYTAPISLKQEVFVQFSNQFKAKHHAIHALLNKSCSVHNQSYLGMSSSAFQEIEITGNVSGHDYDETALGLIEKHKNGILLDAGAGLRSVYYSNVVNLEVADYPTTDVIAFADQLPFQDNSFDAVFSLNVLEHVPNPFEAAKELHRVLKPGGDLYVAVPFLQPFHGYPNHYYNMTTSGLKQLFSKGFNNVDCGVLKAGHPIYSLSWMLQSYVNGLPENQRDRFRDLSVKEIISATQNPKKDWISQLSKNAQEELSCVNYLTATKHDI